MAAPKKADGQTMFAWEGKDKNGKIVRGELRAASETIVRTTVRRQGVMVTKVKSLDSRLQLSSRCRVSIERMI
jgi:type IV pilus assembly protein PilC